MITLKDFFKKYVNYVLVSLIVAISGLSVINDLVSLDTLIESLDNGSSWSIPVAWFLDIIICGFILTVSIMTLVNMRKLTEKKEDYVFSFLAFNISVISFGTFLSSLLVIIETADLNSTAITAKQIMALIIIAAIAVLSLLSVVIKFNDKKTKYILMLVALLINFVLFSNATTLIGSTSPLSVLMVLLSVLGFVVITIYLALTCTKKDEETVEDKE